MCVCVLKKWKWKGCNNFLSKELRTLLSKWIVSSNSNRSGQKKTLAACVQAAFVCVSVCVYASCGTSVRRATKTSKSNHNHTSNIILMIITTLLINCLWIDWKEKNWRKENGKVMSDEKNNRAFVLTSSARALTPSQRFFLIHYKANAFTNLKVTK